MTFHPRPQPHRLGPYSGDADNSLPQITNDADEMLQILFEDLQSLDTKVDALITALTASITTLSGAGASGPQGIDGPDGEDSTSGMSCATAITIPIPTQGSVLFGGPSGAIAQNNANFFWDNTNRTFGIGTNAPNLTGFTGRVFTLYSSTLGETSAYELVGNRDLAAQAVGQFAFLNLQSASADKRIAFFSGQVGNSGDTRSGALRFRLADSGGTLRDRFFIDDTGAVGVGTITPTAGIHIRAGSASASSAPIKLVSGTVMTSPEAGTIEFTTDDFFATITTGPARKAFVLDDGTRLTSGRVPFATTNGRLIDDSDMTFATDTLTVTKIALTDRLTTYNNVATEGYGVPAIVDSVALTAQTADIGSTNVTNANVAGQYEVDYYLEATNADLTAGTVTLTFSFTDGAGATTVASAALVLTSAGRTSGHFPVHLASGSLSYATSHTGIFGTSQYALYITTKRLS